MAATDGETAFVELMQLQTGSGPCMDCYRTGRARSIPDITAERERWPRLITAMTGAGYRSLHAVPVRLHTRTLGTLTLLNTATTNMPRDDLVNRTMEPALIPHTPTGSRPSPQRAPCTRSSPALTAPPVRPLPQAITHTRSTSSNSRTVRAACPR
jgi:hypothetical protein